MVGQALLSLAAAVGRSLAPGSFGREARLGACSPGLWGRAQHTMPPQHPSCSALKQGGTCIWPSSHQCSAAIPSIPGLFFVLEIASGFFSSAELAVARVEVQWLLCPPAV